MVTLVWGACAALLVGAWWLGRGAPVGWRLLFVGLMAVLLAGMSLPPELIRELAHALMRWWPGASRTDLVTRGSSGVAHVLLFALVSAWLVRWRRDLGGLRLLALLGSLSIITEVLQLAVEGRFASLGDVGLNLLGAAIGAAVLVLVLRARWW
jgi:VanZ family protein